MVHPLPRPLVGHPGDSQPAPGRNVDRIAARRGSAGRPARKAAAWSPLEARRHLVLLQPGDRRTQDPDSALSRRQRECPPAARVVSSMLANPFSAILPARLGWKRRGGRRPRSRPPRRAPSPVPLRGRRGVPRPGGRHVPPTSSSWPNARWTVRAGRKPSPRSISTASSSPTTADLSSMAPRPQIKPSTIRPPNGSSCQLSSVPGSTGTTSWNPKVQRESQLFFGAMSPGWLTRLRNLTSMDSPLVGEGPQPLSSQPYQVRFVSPPAKTRRGIGHGATPHGQRSGRLERDRARK